MKVTLKDIAKETGYSISTISRVLSNVGKISDKARDEILQAAERLQYPVARIKGYERKKELLNIALITDFHEGEFYASYFYGFLRAARSENVRLSLLSVNNPRQEIKKFITDLLKENYYDGAILFMPELEREDYQKLIDVVPDHFPMVSNALIENPLLSTITFDGYSGGHQAAMHFYEQGYRKVGIVNGPARKAETLFRFNGFNDFIHSKPDMELVWKYEGDFEFESGVQGFRDFLKKGKQAEAVFVSNDLMATAFIDTAKSNGIHIPAGLAILGYDDLPVCRHSHPLISSIRTDFTRLGTTTLRTLKNGLAGDNQSYSVLSLIPVNIMIRESTLRNQPEASVNTD